VFKPNAVKDQRSHLERNVFCNLIVRFHIKENAST
jgi:hypothetical protein